MSVESVLIILAIGVVITLILAALSCWRGWKDGRQESSAGRPVPAIRSWPLLFGPVVWLLCGWLSSNFLGDITGGIVVSAGFCLGLYCIARLVRVGWIHKRWLGVLASGGSLVAALGLTYGLFAAVAVLLS